MTAGRPVTRAKSHAATTLGRIEPAANSSRCAARSASGWAAVIARGVGVAKPSWTEATSVAMSLARRGAALELVVRDSGRGFDHVEATAQAEHGRSLGLLGMRERAGLIGAALTVESVPGHGTAIRVLLPLVTASAELTEPARRSA